MELAKDALAAGLVNNVAQDEIGNLAPAGQLVVRRLREAVQAGVGTGLSKDHERRVLEIHRPQSTTAACRERGSAQPAVTGELQCQDPAQPARSDP